MELYCPYSCLRLLRVPGLQLQQLLIYGNEPNVKLGMGLASKVVVSGILMQRIVMFFGMPIFATL